MGRPVRRLLEQPRYKTGTMDKGNVVMEKMGRLERALPSEK